MIHRACYKMGKGCWLFFVGLFSLAHSEISEDSYLVEVIPRSSSEVKFIEKVANSADAGLLSAPEVDSPTLIVLNNHNRDEFLSKMANANLTVNFLDLDKFVKEERDEIEARKHSFTLDRFSKIWICFHHIKRLSSVEMKVRSTLISSTTTILRRLKTFSSNWRPRTKT